MCKKKKKDIAWFFFLMNSLKFMDRVLSSGALLCSQQMEAEKNVQCCHVNTSKHPVLRLRPTRVTYLIHISPHILSSCCVEPFLPWPSDLLWSDKLKHWSERSKHWSDRSKHTGIQRNVFAAVWRSFFLCPVYEGLVRAVGCFWFFDRLSACVFSAVLWSSREMTGRQVLQQFSQCSSRGGESELSTNALWFAKRRPNRSLGKWRMFFSRFELWSLNLFYGLIFLFSFCYLPPTGHFYLRIIKSDRIKMDAYSFLFRG